MRERPQLWTFAHFFALQNHADRKNLSRNKKENEGGLSYIILYQ